MPEIRKLATIMSVDVAGYSRAAERDDAAAAQGVRKLRAKITEIIAPLQGRIFNAAGDGFMVEFPTASAGVSAAITLLAESPRDADPLPKIRAGLHLGEVIVEENGDLLGHGVNVAARLQALAAPGSAMVSEAVRAQVRSTGSAIFKAQGRVQLDKMDETIAVYALTPDGRSGSNPLTRRRLTRVIAATCAIVAAGGLTFFALQGAKVHDIPTPRIAVMRFESLGDTEPYFAEGVADELIGELQRVPALEVTARTSSFSLTGAAATPENAARRLGASLVLTGSVRRLPQTLQVRAELVEAPSGRQLWNETFERPHADIYALQRDIAVRVAGAVGLRVSARPTRQVDPETYRLYLAARERALNAQSSEFGAVRDLFRAVVGRDPDFAEAWRWLARTEFQSARHEHDSTHAYAVSEFTRTLAAAERAIALDPSAWEPYAERANALSYLGRWAEAAQANALAMQHGGYSRWFLLLTGQSQEALVRARRDVELDPFDARKLSDAVSACPDTRCAVEYQRRLVDLSPDPYQIGSLYIVLHETGDEQGARSLLQSHPDLPSTLSIMMGGERYGRWVLGSAPPPSVAEINRDVTRARFPVDAGVATLRYIGQAGAAAPLLRQWGPAQRPSLYALYSPGYAPLRRSGEFWALMTREGLVDYWRQSGHWPDFCAQEPVCNR